MLAASGPVSQGVVPPASAHPQQASVNKGLPMPLIAMLENTTFHTSTKPRATREIEASMAVFAIEFLKTREYLGATGAYKNKRAAKEEAWFRYQKSGHRSREELHNNSAYSSSQRFCKSDLEVMALRTAFVKT
ncbi:hypothetical protein JHW43_002906 [Diplocarpon mali]|nr:hypothetical protein JHW43_002906 [Diplocarpon mali]